MKIKLKINLLLLVLGMVSTVLITLFQYYVSKKQVIDDAFDKAELINSFALASRQYTVETMRPLAVQLAGPDQFHPQIMGGFFVARAIGDHFAKAQPGYSFKQSTINPINASNKSTRQEKEVIDFFNSHRNETIQKGILQKNGQDYFFTAKPIVAQKGCLKCHGNKEDAPAGRVQKYPGPGGYNYKANTVVAAFFTYIPVEKALGNLKATSLKIASVGIGTTIFILFIIWLFIGKFITRPIDNLTMLANQVSKGKLLAQEISFDSKDEIGDLYQSFDRMRKSVIKLIKMIQRKK